MDRHARDATVADIHDERALVAVGERVGLDDAPLHQRIDHHRVCAAKVAARLDAQADAVALAVQQLAKPVASEPFSVQPDKLKARVGERRQPLEVAGVEGIDPIAQIINMKHELVQLAGKLDWAWIDGEIAPLYSEQGRPGIASRFVIGLLRLKHIYGLSDEGVCERWVHDPYFQYFSGEEFFQHEFPHERSDLSHWRKRLGDKLELLLAESLRVAHASGALRTKDLARVTVDTTVHMWTALSVQGLFAVL